MARYLNYCGGLGTNWTNWLMVLCILSVPFFWGRARRTSLFFHQAVNFLAWSVRAALRPTDTSGTGNDAMGLAFLLAFGVGYSILTLRKESSSEKPAAWVFLALFCLGAVLIVRHYFSLVVELLVN